MPTRLQLDFAAAWLARDTRPFNAWHYANGKPYHLACWERETGWAPTPAGEDILATIDALEIDPATARADDDPKLELAQVCATCNGSLEIQIIGSFMNPCPDCALGFAWVEGPAAVTELLKHAAQHRAPVEVFTASGLRFTSPTVDTYHSTSFSLLAPDGVKRGYSVVDCGREYSDYFVTRARLAAAETPREDYLAPRSILDYIEKLPVRPVHVWRTTGFSELTGRNYSRRGPEIQNLPRDGSEDTRKALRSIDAWARTAVPVILAELAAADPVHDLNPPGIGED